MKEGYNMKGTFIQKQTKVIEKNYKCVAIKHIVKDVVKYFDIRPLECTHECVKIMYRNNEPICFEYCDIPIELICKDIKFGGF